ncbi:uncharacterized protein LOC134787174 [Penaeus indicus]|uniref:uncharacterized protein LOC134787174 n=1 Tax=Penaeus indicus TaxID=29960 RepID=UPI00300C50B0
MAALRTVAVLLVVMLSLAAVSESLVLCPSFPGCCRSRSCHALCPSCREARNFVNGVRKRPSGRVPSISFIEGDPFAFPNCRHLPQPADLHLSLDSASGFDDSQAERSALAGGTVSRLRRQQKPSWATCGGARTGFLVRFLGLCESTSQLEIISCGFFLSFIPSSLFPYRYTSDFSLSNIASYLPPYFLISGSWLLVF